MNLNLEERHGFLTLLSEQLDREAKAAKGAGRK